MNISFQHIIDIQLKHRYFTNGKFSTISFTIPNESEKLSRNLGLFIKPIEGGISIFASNGDLLESSVTDESPIRMYLYSQEPNYVNFTELMDFVPIRDVLYFNNLGGGQFLHEGAAMRKEDIYPWTPGPIKLPLFDQTKNYEFRDVNNRKLPKESIQKLSSGEGEFMISNYQEGIISVYIESTKIYQVYYKPERVWKKPFAVLEIFPSMLFKYYNIEGKKELFISFKNRKTYWKYFLIDPVYQKFKNLDIINSKKEAVFGSPTEIEIHGKKAKVFESIEAIPLQENLNSHLKLINKDDSSPQVIINLPAASPNSIYQDNPESKESMYSHIYV